jgi:polar amino acid transport system substrate-binding protein
MSARRVTCLLWALLVTGLGAGCASATDAATTRAVDALAPVTTTTTEAVTEGGSGPSHCDDPGFDPGASFEPAGPTPLPGRMPEGTAMRGIQDRGELVVGVDENTRYFSSRNPDTRQLEGFEPDLARLIAEAIFGPGGAGRVRFVPLVTSQKVSAVKDRTVDMTISVVSKSCDRWDEVDFTSTYYVTSQGILVPKDSSIESVADLDGRRVCATDGSSSQTYLQDNTAAEVVAVPSRTDCLVALQESRVDAILLPYSILAGLAAQDPGTRVLDARPKTQSYGIPVAKEEDEELVMFLNSLLERWRTDGTLAELQSEFPDTLWVDPATLEPRWRLP